MGSRRHGIGAATNCLTAASSRCSCPSRETGCEARSWPATAWLPAHPGPTCSPVDPRLETTTTADRDPHRSSGWGEAPLVLGLDEPSVWLTPTPAHMRSAARTRLSRAVLTVLANPTTDLPGAELERWAAMKVARGRLRVHAARSEQGRWTTAAGHRAGAGCCTSPQTRSRRSPPRTLPRSSSAPVVNRTSSPRRTCAGCTGTDRPGGIGGVSACAVGDADRPVTRAAGLPGAPLDGGARAVVAALWPVDDLASFCSWTPSTADLAQVLTGAVAELRGTTLRLPSRAAHGDLRGAPLIASVSYGADERPFAEPAAAICLIAGRWFGTPGRRFTSPQ